MVRVTIRSGIDRLHVAVLWRNRFVSLARCSEYIAHRAQQHEQQRKQRDRRPRHAARALEANSIQSSRHMQHLPTTTMMRPHGRRDLTQVKPGFRDPLLWKIG